MLTVLWTWAKGNQDTLAGEEEPVTVPLYPTYDAARADAVAYAEISRSIFTVYKVIPVAVHSVD